MKAAMIALVVRREGEALSLLDTLSDDREIALLESACDEGLTDPLQNIYDRRQRQVQEDNEFGDYVEELLSQPFLRPEIREHGVQWLKSKIRIEEYQKTEVEAAKTIADFAYRMFLENPKMTDFSLTGSATIIRVRVFVLGNEKAVAPQSNAA
ncbi:MAG: hypothetical protein A2603_07085 [Bdellovibrionales bacterium RIFOXYD1_FULL_55_31]|nr:MAG: hypothetical protein A2603_07085 [Bdellovibrionales bacterium RIFOXYD1_FULL_55_31]